MNINWGMIGLIVLNTIIWCCIFKYGFLYTLLWIVVGTCLVAIIIKLKDMRV